MSKMLTVKNPLTNNGGSLFDPSMWLGGILWVVMFGLIMAMGTKALNVLDSKVPGNQTPAMSPYIQPKVASNGINVL